MPEFVFIPEFKDNTNIATTHQQTTYNSQQYSCIFTQHLSRIILKRSYRLSLFYMHAIVLIYGFTAILGKLIEMPAIPMVWYRMLFASLSLLIFLKLKKKKVILPWKESLRYLSIGTIVALHWITFFHAIKISNISITLGITASGALFASLLEPVIIKRKINWIEIVIGVFIVLGLYIIFNYELNYLFGIIVALIATILATLFTIFNKKFTHKHPPSIITLYEMTGGFLAISAYILVNPDHIAAITNPSLNDIFYVLILGTICTAFAFMVSVDVMKELSAFTVLLTINMEPIYGIILAFYFFKDSEFMSGGFYLGTLIILASVFIYPLVLKKTKG